MHTSAKYFCRRKTSVNQTIYFIMRQANIIFLGIAVALLLASCHPSKPLQEEAKSNIPWEEYTPERKRAIIKQAKYLENLITDENASATTIRKYLLPFMDTCDLAIGGNCIDYEFVLFLRGFCRKLGMELAQREMDTNNNCLLRLLALPCKWSVLDVDSVCTASTSMFRFGKESRYRVGNLFLQATDDSQTATLIVTNYIDTAMNNIQLAFADSVGNVKMLLTPGDGIVDTSQWAADGIIRVVYPLETLLPHLIQDAVMELHYDTPQEHIQMVHLLSLPRLPEISPAEQLKIFHRFVKF